MPENEREIQKHRLLTCKVWTTALAGHPRTGATAEMHREGLHQLAAQKSPRVNVGTWS